VSWLHRLRAFFPSVEHVLRRLSLRVQVAILEAFGQLSALASQLNLDGAPSDCRAVLNAFIDNERAVPFIGYIPADGLMECSFPEVPIVDFSEEITFRSLMESPIQSGMLSMSLPSKYLEWVTRTKDLPPEARFAIVTANGVGVTQSKPATDFDWLPSAASLRAILLKDDRIQELRSRTGDQRVYAIAPLFQKDIFAISSWPHDHVPARLGWRNLLTISLPMLMWALAVAVAYFAVDQLALRHIVYLDRLVGAYGRSGP